MSRLSGVASTEPGPDDPGDFTEGVGAGPQAHASTEPGPDDPGDTASRMSAGVGVTPLQRSRGRMTPEIGH